jgi:methanogenic corrinoid protein MtbC1
LLKESGFTVHDLGVDVSAERFVEAIHELQPDLVGLFALPMTTMPAMDTVIKAIDNAGVRDQVKVIVGSAPITEEFARSIGADGYDRDACGAAEQVKQLIAQAR